MRALAPCGDCQQLLQRHGALAERAATGIAPETLGRPITEQQFTTLENTPPDFLL